MIDEQTPMGNDIELELLTLSNLLQSNWEEFILSKSMPLELEEKAEQINDLMCEFYQEIARCKH